MELTKYISDLLYRYECVIVPEFGAFLTQQKSACIDTAMHVFLPPRKEIIFNEQLQQNDGLLANHIASATQITYNEAVTKIADFVADIKGKLIAGENIIFSSIGHFSLNTEGKLQFIPTTEVNFLTSAFGLTSTVKTPILREVYKQEVETLEEKAPITFIPETRKKRKKKPYLQYAAIALFSLGVFGFLTKNYIDTKQIEIAEHNEKENIKATKIAYQTASFFDVNPVSVPEATLPITVEKKNTGKYHIIAGAFRFEENAHKKISQLKEQGFDARLIGINKYGLHQVVYASYEDRLEALKSLRKIKQNHNSTAWLLVKDMK